MTDGYNGGNAVAYARVYEEQQPHLVAYARSLTGNPWLAEDVVAEAHFRVWRRLSAGHEIDNVAAYLTRTVRNLAMTVGSAAARETPVEPEQAGADVIEPVSVSFTGSAADPSARVSQIDLLRRVLGQLPERWVKALWLAEAEDLPLDVIGRRIGAGRGATAVLLHRAREGMRQAFLRAHPGTPQDPACEVHWERIPALIRDAAAPRHAAALRAHLDACEDCRSRYLLLARANHHLGALVGPALLAGFLGGGAKFLAPVLAGAPTGAGGAGAPGASGASAAPAISGAAGPVRGVGRVVRQLVTGGFKAPAAVLGSVGVTVTGAAIGVGLLVGAADQPVPPARTATHDATPSTPTRPLSPLVGGALVLKDVPVQGRETGPVPPSTPPVPSRAPEDAPRVAPQTTEDAPPSAVDPGRADTPGQPTADEAAPQDDPAAEPADAVPTAPASAQPTPPPQPNSPPVGQEPGPAAPSEPAPGDTAPSVPAQPPGNGTVPPPAPDPTPVQTPDVTTTPAPLEPEPTPPTDPAPAEPTAPEPVNPTPTPTPPSVTPESPTAECHDILRGHITVTICTS
ncbi:sigma-70 family RNA polymerase sigma factor [Streptomyces indicus]|uniref:RNA polymerase sigma factor, sigma-70 family n=1 Tax=Streptomyces indicus TaxID=417292 RepID=A0A1G9GLV6_9ACTN|nr:sigma-70 family RNA polymerase sigma factor [Streptomyces indicus]SDL01636.1 RNA polymerase sigma factor, sigma-70 family [Streptomyces indicus]